jgi:hypothetical protein
VRRPAPVERPGRAWLETPFDRVQNSDDLALSGDGQYDVRPEGGDGGYLIAINSAAGPCRRIVDGEIIRAFLERGRRS